MRLHEIKRPPILFFREDDPAQHDNNQCRQKWSPWVNR